MKRPGHVFHVLYGGGEEGRLVQVADSQHAGTGHVILWLPRKIVQSFPCARFRCVCLYRSSQTRLPVPIHPAIHGASPALCWIWPRNISSVWGSPCMLWACSRIPDTLPGWSCAMPARALADTGRVTGETVFPSPPCAYASDSPPPAVSRLAQAGGTPARCDIQRPVPCTSAASPAAFQYPLEEAQDFCFIVAHQLLE